MRTKRTRTTRNVGASMPAGAANADSEDWKEYVSEDIIAQLNKHQLPYSEILDEKIADLANHWHFQYVMAWLSNVCESYTTTTFNTDQYGGSSTKCLWKNIKFDEGVFVTDVSSKIDGKDSNYYNDEVDVDEGSQNLYDRIRLQLLHQLAGNKSGQLKDWNVIVNHHLQNSSAYSDLVTDLPFLELEIARQFDIIYSIIKLIEMKNMIFKNYLANNLHLFTFSEVILDDGNSGREEMKSLFALPNVGVLVKKTIHRVKEGSSSQISQTLNIPIKLQNCTIKESDPDIPDSVELIHLEYSHDIDAYLQSITIDYDVITTNWGSMLEYWSENKSSKAIDEFITNLIPVYAEHRLYSAKLLANREKERAIAELMTRRKRSSRLVAKEEENKKKDLESEWFEKLDEREQFIRHRNKLVSKEIKKIKDLLWNQLWQLYDQDYRDEKLTRRNELKDRSGSGTPFFETSLGREEDNPLNEIDIGVLDHGPNFQSSIIPVEPPIPGTVGPLQTGDVPELPSDFCITKEELDELANYGIFTPQQEPDNQDSVFQCPGEPELAPMIITEDTETDLFNNRPLICCDHCYRWQHWECQPPKIIELISSTTKSPQHTLSQRDFGVIIMGNSHGNRRSSRRPQSTLEPSTKSSRPTDKRKPLSECSTFICAWCIRDLELELRNIFVPELKIIRAKQRKQQEDRERRKKMKEEKKRLEELAKKRELTESVSPPVFNNAFANMSSSTTPSIAAYEKTNPAINPAPNVNAAHPIITYSQQTGSKTVPQAPQAPQTSQASIQPQQQQQQQQQQQPLHPKEQNFHFQFPPTN
ncbi:Ioc2p [Saccharomyces cerevisiae YJM789]|uniref:Ioc2p n=1 Tax=Saccharomyces cerevisiae (strain YJM789) TaxID=307796 RepID=A7A0Z9_YEAS7|nr:Ioc2p [Saccharomyces cerevisiae YJM789]